MNLDEAYKHCQNIAENHYENFPVASVLVSKKIRKHVFAVYAFARYADDLADEMQDRDGLLEWQKKLHDAFITSPNEPIFIALKNTIIEKKLPIQLFDNLISAFLQDLNKTRYENMETLLDYCKRSANPVGRLVLLLHDISDERAFKFSDNICTALQLTNFWQDVSVDIEKKRIYIPLEKLKLQNVTEQQIYNLKFNKNVKFVMTDLVDFTQAMFENGRSLLPLLPLRLRIELSLTIAGGEAILMKIRAQNYDVLSKRPKLKKSDWLKLLAFAPFRY